MEEIETIRGVFLQLDFSDYLIIGALVGPNSTSKDLETKAHNIIGELKIANINLLIATNEMGEKKNNILAKNINEYNRFFDERYIELSPKLKEEVESLDRGIQKELQEIKTHLESKKSLSIEQLIRVRENQSKIGKEYLSKKIKIANDVELKNRINAIEKKIQSNNMPSFIKKIAMFFQKAQARIHQKNILKNEIKKYTFIVLPMDKNWGENPPVYLARKRKIQNFCVSILNFFKGFSICYPFILIFIFLIGLPFSHLISRTEMGTKIADAMMMSGFYWVLWFIPIYWSLLIIQWIMTITFNNKNEYFNVFEMMKN